MTSTYNGGPSSHETAAHTTHDTVIVTREELIDKVVAHAAAWRIALPVNMPLYKLVRCHAIDNPNEPRGFVRRTEHGAELCLDERYVCFEVQP